MLAVCTQRRHFDPTVLLCTAKPRLNSNSRGEQQNMEKEENVEEPVSEESVDNEELDFSKDNPNTSPEPTLTPENLTGKQKIIYYADRIFLCFLVLLFVVLLLEAIYKIWYITNWTAISKYLRDLARWLTAQEEQEELLEL
ncbi:hypothetical protein scyTo_0026573 [Scyliorhinus torazame]|uniref:Uncharacterized protein n=1 Tax=Scyliorhinus torazame TaxID=75743 RepID=A0A401QKE5_SCYTO|nr:hypothetical protein [Scyliorhinus torazame]